MRLTSEFASVEIERDDCGNGPRLLIRDAQTGMRVLLDPLELAALARVRHDELAPFLDPSRHLREAPISNEPDMPKSNGRNGRTS
ncbi:MAG: hypothetical protein IVW56_03820 [Candidatus Binataceae bacterium]|nr:hypothetical protein [Candidatus Binataceae bacterium]